MINMMEKVPTRVNTRTPFTNFWTAKNLHGSAFSLLATRGTVQVFELQTVPRRENLRVPSKRGIYLVWTVQRAFWKRSEWEKQWREAVRSESRKNSFNGTFNKTELLPDPSGIPGYGKRYEWFILTALVNIGRYITLWKYEVTAMRSSVRRLTFKKVLRPLALLAALRPKMPAPQTDSTACTMLILTNSW